MRIELITISKNTPNWIATGYQEYAKRLPKDYQLILTEISPLQRNKNTNLEKVMEKEGERIFARIPAHSHIVALDEHGSIWNTKRLAENSQKWHSNYNHICLLIGGAEGLAPKCLSHANETWSLSALTFPHHMVRIIVAEQLYRAWSILTNHPYHRGDKC